MDIKGRTKGKQIKIIGILLGICVAVVSLFYFFHAEKAEAERKNGRDCKLCESAVLHLHPL